MQIIQTQTEQHLAVARELFLEYADALGFDLCFQNFDQELADLPGDYAPPRGRLLLAFGIPSAPQRAAGFSPREPSSELHSEHIPVDRSPAGCVALRPFDSTTCEMKRFYVRPAFRGQGIGRKLASIIVEQARDIGYARMVLDTVPAMTAAITLYESMGFADIGPYRDNPIEGARYMALDLR